VAEPFAGKASKQLSCHVFDDGPSRLDDRGASPPTGAAVDGTVTFRRWEGSRGSAASRPPPGDRYSPRARRRMGMRLSLMPKKSFFFDQFDKHATNSLEAAVALERLLTDFTEIERKVRDIHAIEHYGDQLTHEIFKSLNETFVTPLDREDIIGIASKLDDVADVAYDVSELILLYKVRSVRPHAVRQAKALVGAATEMVAMMKALEGLKGLEPYWIKIHTFENEGDQVFRDAVGDLFENVKDPIDLIKWKDIHSLIEVAVDRCEDVANIVEMIVIKHS
jgi:predicted phosphate transport protein (TIGR00153 family)